jgi:hypothetical protein
MKFSEFLKTFKGNLVSVRDYRMSYCYNQESEIADREVEEINSDENGVYVKLKAEIQIPLVDFLSIYSGESVAIKFDKEWVYMKVNEAMKDYKDCAVIKIANMDNVLRLVLKRDIYRSNE